MSENIFWVYNGWAILITVLGPIYMVCRCGDAKAHIRATLLVWAALHRINYRALLRERMDSRRALHTVPDCRDFNSVHH